MEVHVLENLNAAQLEAVQSTDGPVLVVAGAGSGKTKVLTSRIAHLLNQKKAVSSEILAFTFTNKAAKEMKERVEGLIGEVASSMWIGTFHSICNRMLRRDIDKIGYHRHFVIYDTTDQKTLIKQQMKAMSVSDKDYSPYDVLARISKAKGDMLTPEQWFERYGHDHRQEVIGQLYEKYQKKLKENNALDFDDLIVLTIRLLKSAPDVRAAYQRRFRYIHVDEYQDTNKLQYQLITLLTPENKNIFAVGDADQSIYKWRGADISNIRNFEVDFPGAKTILLEQNYRSTGNILQLANSVISHNPMRKEKKLWTDQGAGDLIQYYCAYDEKDEANYVARQVEQASLRSYKDFAILYRTNAQSRQFEDAFRRIGIPTQVIGGLKFYERKEIKDMLAYLRLIVNPADDIAVERVINVPRRGIGAKSIDKIKHYAQEYGISLLKATGESVGLSAKAQTAAHSFYEVVTSISPEDALSAFDQIIMQTKMIDLLEKENTVEADGRIDNIYELRSAIEESGAVSLEDFLSEASLSTSEDRTEAEEAVTLMTLHTSKGLEYPVVFVVGLEQELFPSGRSAQEVDGIEEERRLCYVGITRAQQQLYVTHAKNRNLYGRYQSRVPSIFLKEMDDSLFDQPLQTKVDRQDLSGKERFQSFYKLAQKTVEKKESALSTTEWRQGDKVRHNSFGEGLVITLDKGVCTIAFDRVGIKKLDPTIAMLEKIEK